MKITSKKKKKVTRGVKKKEKKNKRRKNWNDDPTAQFLEEGGGEGIKTAIKSPLKTQYAFHKFRGIASTDISVRVIRIPVRPDIYDGHTRSSKTALYRSQVNVRTKVFVNSNLLAAETAARGALPSLLGSFYKPLSEE